MSRQKRSISPFKRHSHTQNNRFENTFENTGCMSSSACMPTPLVNQTSSIEHRRQEVVLQTLQAFSLAKSPFELIRFTHLHCDLPECASVALHLLLLLPAAPLSKNRCNQLTGFGDGNARTTSPRGRPLTLPNIRLCKSPECGRTEKYC